MKQQKVQKQYAPEHLQLKTQRRTKGIPAFEKIAKDKSPQSNVVYNRPAKES